MQSALTEVGQVKILQLCGTAFLRAPPDLVSGFNSTILASYRIGRYACRAKPGDLVVWRRCTAEFWHQIVTNRRAYICRQYVPPTLPTRRHSAELLATCHGAVSLVTGLQLTPNVISFPTTNEKFPVSLSCNIFIIIITRVYRTCVRQD